jgi:regulator of sirC expression with transglutaminase-like and TPR domain
MQVPGSPRAQLAALLERPDHEIDLARAALLVAAEDDPALDPDAALATLRAWGDRLASAVPPECNSLQRLARLRNFMFEELGFRGDVQGYYSPQNSLLHSVMERRLGIPLTLGVVFLELGWRLGLDLHGVAFPSHFLVRLAGEAQDLLLDAYDHGGSVHEEDCRRMLLASSAGMIEFHDGMIRSIGRRDTVGRLLHNLKIAWLREGDDARALSATDRLLLVYPGSPPEVRDRGLLLYRLDEYRDALEALEFYLELRPDGVDREDIEQHVGALRMMLAA